MKSVRVLTDFFFIKAFALWALFTLDVPMYAFGQGLPPSDCPFKHHFSQPGNKIKKALFRVP